jgi:Protein of unknown function (DUF3108)
VSVPERPRWRLQPFGAVLLVVLGYSIATIVFTWPLPVSLRSHLGAPEGPGDPYLNLWILGWDLRTLTARPVSLVDGTIFNANIFHPATGTLAYSDHLLPQAVALLPLYWATGDPVLCYNVLLIVSFLASAIAMHALARTLGAPHLAAAVAGITWAFWPYRVAHLIHLQLQALYFLPLAVLALHRLMAGARRADAVWLGLLTALQALSSLYYGVATAIALAVGVLSLGLGTGRLRNARLIGRLALATVVGALVIAPIVWPYWRMQQEEGFARNLYEASRHAAIPSSYLQVPAVNRIYGRTHLLTARDASDQLRPGRTEGVEVELFPGFTVCALAIVGFVATRRSARWPVAWTMVALGATAWVLSLGPDGVRTLYAAFHAFVFGFQAVRAPARFAVLVTFALAVLAAFGASLLYQRRGGPAIVCSALALVLVEYASMPWPLVERPALRTAVGQWLLATPGPGAVLYLPLTNDRRNTIAMVDSLQHGRPVVNGYSGQRPSFYAALVDTVSTFPSAESLWTLRDFDVRFVVSRQPLDLAAATTPLVERARLAEGVVYEMVWTPEVEARLIPPAPPPPPPPGPTTFAIGEALRYDVRWVGGPMGVAAGSATVSVVAGPSASTPFRFVATADTAEWVARFFEAHDRFETDAGSDLLPQVHRRTIREGRRSIDREYGFDPHAGVVRIGTPGLGDALPFRIPASTRDALTAFFYMRTLPLAAGETVAFPVSDGGRNLVVTVRSSGKEQIVVQGRSVPAIRLEPAISERVPRRDPVKVTAWLSDDGRRVLLAADIAAGFGQLRVELAK